jgi:hypothetical protein
LWSSSGSSRPHDYDERRKLTYTSHWIDKFHDIYHKITLDKDDLKWMQNATEIGIHTKKFSHIYDDDLDQTCQKYQIPQGDWFIRTDKVSLKYGQHGIGPYNNLAHILESVVTSNNKHSCFDIDDNFLNIYFLPWRKIDPEKEFRVFVSHNQITAISAQDIFNVTHWLVHMSPDEISRIGSHILNYFSTHIQHKLSYLESYTFDFVFTDPDNEPYFIEPNGFGADYSAGSALFHWVNDHDKLHDPTTIELRYIDH